ncbi:hypothetical protein HWV62_26628 [Athelia sp. TMB]|nr:hypothetical protein HWV62_26628 [Athelia sp. TMB]
MTEDWIYLREGELLITTNQPSPIALYLPGLDPTMSLFEVLTDVKVDNHENASTQLIQDLLNVSAFDACTAKRNTFSAFGLLSDARDLCKEIHKLAKQVDEAEALDDWVAYDKYTAAIDPLEQLLFKIVDWVAKESGLFLNNTSTIAEAIEFIATWEKARVELVKLKTIESKELQSIKPASSFSDAELQRHDDRCLVSALCDEISATAFVGPLLTSSQKLLLTQPPTLIAQLKEIAGAIPSKLSPKTDEPSTTLTVKCTMIVQGVVHLTGSTTEADTKAALNDRPVWTKACAMFKKLSDHLADSTKAPIAQAQQLYDDFLNFLQHLVVEIPSEYLDIRRSVKNVMRPYHARTLALASQCRKLVGHFSADKKPADLPALAEALKAAMAALEAAAQAMNVVSLITFEDKDIEGTPAAKAFSTAEEKVETCYKAYNPRIKLGDWTAEAAGMATALSKDKALVTQMKERFAQSNKTSIPPILPDSKVKVTIQKDKGKPETYEADKSATLNELVWRALSKDGTATIHDWHLEQGDATPRKRVSFHKVASDVSANGTLYLVHTGSKDDNANNKIDIDVSAPSDVGLSTSGGEGEGSKDEKHKGEKPQGEKPKGEKPEGEKPEGENPEGEKPEGEKPEGENPKQ